MGYGGDCYEFPVLFVAAACAEGRTRLARGRRVAGPRNPTHAQVKWLTVLQANWVSSRTHPMTVIIIEGGQIQGWSRWQPTVSHSIGHGLSVSASRVLRADIVITDCAKTVADIIPGLCGAGQFGRHPGPVEENA